MPEDLAIIQMNIRRYRAMLKLDLSSGKRSTVETLLAEANNRLKLAKNWHKVTAIKNHRI